jgi:hypothetical protein
MSRQAPGEQPYHHGVADDVQPSAIRIGDTERESALAALGEHMSAGRLDIDEYGDRTARVATSKTRGDLSALFSDLPAPHPTFGVATQRPTPVQPAPPVPVPAAGIPMRHRIAASAVPLAGLIALALFIALHTWIVFLIPAAVVLFGGAIFGDDWKHQKRLNRERYRQERRDIRRHHHW